MSWILFGIAMFLLCSVAMAIYVFMRRTQKRKHMEGLIQNWETHCKETDSDESIFVLVCTARRDGVSDELLPTIDSIFQFARCPYRVHVAIVAKEGSLDAVSTLFPNGEAQREFFPHASRFIHQVSTCSERTSHGASAARAHGVKLLSRERFLLLVHSRATFCANWDYRLIHDHGGVPKRVVTQMLSDSPSEALTTSVISTVDMDLDGFPFLAPKHFEKPPASARATLFASPNLLFGLAAELVRVPNLIGSSHFLYSGGNLDAFLTTLVLKSHGFTLRAPQKRIVQPSLQRSRQLDRRRSSSGWRARVAVHTAQALLSALFAEDAFKKAIGDSDMIERLASPSSTWIHPALGASFFIPSTMLALRAIAKDGDEDITAGFRAAMAKSVVNARELMQSNSKSHVIQVIAAKQRLVASSPLRPGDRDWGDVLRSLMDANRGFVCDMIRAASNEGGVTAILEEMGVDVQTGAMAGRAVLGLGSAAITKGEIEERFGSEAAFRRERARWTFA